MNKLIQVVDYYKTTMYLNPDHIGRVDEVKNSVVLYLNLPKPLDGVILERDEWERIKPMLVIAQNHQLHASKPDNALSTAQAVAEILQEEQPIAWVTVTEVEADTFYSKTSRQDRMMWRLRTSDGRQANLFDHSDPLRDNKPLLQSADYWNIFSNMERGVVDRWTIHPVEIQLVQDGSFWKVTHIKPRVFGNVPDSMSMDAPLSEEDEEFTSTDLSRLLRVVKKNNFVILDTETTGLGNDAEICQIAIIDASGKTLLDSYVKPVRPIPADAMKIHGITNDMIAAAPGWLNVNEQVWNLLHDRDVIVYNAAYDFRLLVQSEGACEPFAFSDWDTMKRVCAMNAYAEHIGDWNDYHGNYQWHRLESAAGMAGYRLPEGMKAHTALADCLMTLAVVRYLETQS